MVDFMSAYVIDGVDKEPAIYKLKSNAKGHFEYDIVYHLTRGHRNHEGHARIHVDNQSHHLSTATLQFRPLDFTCRLLSMIVAVKSRFGNCIIMYMDNPAVRLSCSPLWTPSLSTTSPFVLTCNGMAQKGGPMSHPTMQAEQDMVNFIDQLRPKAPKKESQPPDKTRAMTMDLRDPRAQNTWPCYDNHVEGTWQSNPHGHWLHCSVCNIRMAYVPKKGSPSNSTQVVNHQMVQRMLSELEPLMHGVRPTARICKAMMDKITADVQLETLVNAAIKEKPKATAAKTMVKPKTEGYTSPRMSASQGSWETLTPEQHDIETLLTEKEKAQLRAILHERRTDLELEDQNPNLQSPSME